MQVLHMMRLHHAFKKYIYIKVAYSAALKWKHCSKKQLQRLPTELVCSLCESLLHAGAS